MAMMKWIVRFFPEMMIKGPAVKKRMVHQLYQNLKRLLAKRAIDAKLQRFSDKLELYCDASQMTACRQLLAQTPGVDQFYEAVQYRHPGLTEPQPNFDVIHWVGQKTYKHWGAQLQGQTFAVRVKRTGQHAFSSVEVESGVGQYLLRHAQPKNVDLKDPQQTVYIELHEQTLNVIVHKHPGMGGFPMGSQDAALSLISGGFDSTVASYLSMRRGVKTHYVFFSLGGVAHETGAKQMAWHIWSTYGASHSAQFVTVDFMPVVEALFETIHESYLGLMLKRLMLQASEKVATKMGVQALVTGEAVGQVSSQTMKNLNVLDQSIDLLVLRPLALMDKTKIVSLSQQIHTRRLAEAMPEYCGVISKNPVVNASRARIEKEAARLPPGLVDRVVAQAETLPVASIIADINQTQAVAVVQNKAPGDWVIDIRAPERSQTAPCAECDAQVPFYHLVSQIKQQPQAKRYLLYCDQGVMSQLHAQRLHDLGIKQVNVFRPSEQSNETL